MIENFSARFNTSCDIKLAALQADCLHLACLLAIKGEARGREGRGREVSLKEKWGLNKRKDYLRWMGWGAKQSII